jgi:hypothetical protein
MTHDEAQRVQVGDRVEVLPYDGFKPAPPWLRGSVTGLTIINCPTGRGRRVNRISVKCDDWDWIGSYLPSQVRMLNPLDALSEVK